MNYLLDTSIVLIAIRKKDFRDKLLKKYINGNTPLISVVSLGELRSLGMRNKWGKNKWQQMNDILNLLLIVDIHVEQILQSYAEIDTFSQGKLKNVSFSARNMGKNDLWIAATAHVLDATLITTDNDYNHLDKVYFDLIKIII
jgi:predicted nucleic acid-binding protein